MGKVPSRGSDQFVLRFPEGMRERIKVAAEDSGRSMNAEIIMRLQASLDGQYMDISQEGLLALAGKLAATSRTLEQMMMWQAPEYLEFKLRQASASDEAGGSKSIKDQP